MREFNKKPIDYSCFRSKKPHPTNKKDLTVQPKPLVPDRTNGIQLLYYREPLITDEERIRYAKQQFGFFGQQDKVIYFNITSLDPDENPQNIF